VGGSIAEQLARRRKRSTNHAHKLRKSATKLEGEGTKTRGVAKKSIKERVTNSHHKYSTGRGTSNEIKW